MHSKRITAAVVLSTALGCAGSANDGGDSPPSFEAGASSAGMVAQVQPGSGGNVRSEDSAASGGTSGAGGSRTGASGAGGSAAGASGAGGSDSGGPAPSQSWINATGNLAGMASDCFNMGRVAAKPGSPRIIAGVALHGLFASDDSGKSWQPLGTGAGSAKITNRVSSITFDPEHPETFWETGSHTGSGFYRTTDGGSTFTQLGSLMMAQGASIDFADPDRKTLLTSTHGVGIYKSTDSGRTFIDITLGVPGNTLWPLLLDSRTFLMGTFDQGAISGAVYRTIDGGASWTQVTTLSPSHDATFLRASDDSLYLSLEGNAGIMRSSDLGKTWVKLAGTGATFASPAFGITPIELPDGTLVTIGVDHLLRSSDRGASWSPIGEPLPFKAATDSGGLTYSSQTKTFFIWHADCGNSVLPNAIMSAGFDYTRSSR
jgi:photosystem II stability/assembly factor-like uncharacterized protein